MRYFLSPTLTFSQLICYSRLPCRTSDGYALAAGWALGWSVWSLYGRLGSWSVAGSLSTGYGVEGERSESFEDHFMQGVRNLVGPLFLFLLLKPNVLMRWSTVLEPGKFRIVRFVSATSSSETKTSATFIRIPLFLLTLVD